MTDLGVGLIVASLALWFGYRIYDRGFRKGVQQARAVFTRDFLDHVEREQGQR